MKTTHKLVALLAMCCCTTTVTGSLKMVVAYEAAGVLCTAAIADNLPIPFCWKDADLGKIPKQCKEGYFHEGALCYKNCKDGYNKVTGGTCWESCEKLKLLGFRCEEKDESKRRRKWYTNKPYTHFSDVALCPEGMYKAGALCYNDCKEVGLENCGIGACSYSKSACKKEVTSMAIQTLVSVTTGATFFASLGGSATAKALLSLTAKIIQYSSTIVATVLDKALVYQREHFQKPQYKKNLQQNIAEVVKEQLSKEYFDEVGEQGIETMCRFAVDHWETELEKPEKKTFKEEAKTKLAKVPATTWKAVKDVSGYSECVQLKGGNANEKKACAKTVMAAASYFDPTGVLAIASIFLKPRCNLKAEIEFK